MCYRIKFLIPLFIWCSLIHSGRTTKWIKKCCPRSGYELATEFLCNSQSHSSLECMSIVNATFTQSELTSGRFYGLRNNDSDSPSHLPVCPANAKQELYKLREMDVVTLPLDSSCVDLVDGTYQVVMCTEDSTHPETLDIEVYSIRKCCPVQFIFDDERKECVKVDDQFHDLSISPFWEDEPKDIQILKSLLNQFDVHKNSIGEPLFIVGPPQCHSDDVLVSYQLKSNEFKLRRNRIIPTSKFGGDRHLSVFNSQPRDPFCIESVAPATIHPQKEASDVTNITWMARVCRPRSICDGIPCVRKCCNYNEMVVKRNNQTICDPHPFELSLKFHDLEGEIFPKDPKTVHRPEYGVLFQQTCSRYILDESMPSDLHYLNEKNGHLHILGADPISHEEYCVDYVQMYEYVMQKTFVCFREEVSPYGFFVYAVGLCISCVFLVATLIVYACLPKLLNLHGKTLVSHCSSLLVAYAGLAYIQFGILVQPRFCYAVALFTYGSFLAAFSWLNVMCFDIWWTFGSVRQSRGMRKTRDTKRFIAYSVYAWGIPVTLTTFVHLVDKYTLLHSDYLPNMGKRSCWFANDNGLAHRLFFLLPMGIIFSMNVIFFVLTAVHCNRVKSEIHRMQANDDAKDSHKKRFFADKARMLMNLKLFCVMGITWFMELITSIYKEPIQLWYITDFFNVMQGVFVFLIFVFKRNVLTAIKNRLGIVTQATRGVTTLGVTMTAGTTTTSLMGSHNQVCIDPYGKQKMTKSGSQTAVLNGFHRQKST